MTVAAFEAARAAGRSPSSTRRPAAPIDPALVAATDWLVPNEHEFALIGGGTLDGDEAEEDERIAALRRASGCRSS